MSDEVDNDVEMAFAIAESLRVYTDSNSEPTRIDEDEALRQAILDSQQAYATARLTEFDDDEALRQAILDSQTDTTMLVVSNDYDEDDALQLSIWNSQVDVGEFNEEEVMFNQALMESQVEFDTRTHKTTLLVPLHFVGLIVGKGFSETNRIATHCGANCKISARRVNNSATDQVQCGRILISADTADALDRAEDAVMLRYIRLSSHHSGGVCSKLITPKVIRGPLGQERYRHVYIDNSNIYVTALHAFDGHNDHNSTSSQCNYAVRINVRGLTSLLERGEGGGYDQSPGILPVGIEIATRLTAGSKPPSNNGIWKAYQSMHYRTEVHSRDHESHKETAIDSILHGAALQLVADRGSDDPGANTLVLATGDGNDNGGLTSFPRLAVSAAAAGFRVEIWSWQSSLNRQAFEAVSHMFPDGRVSIHLLDPHKLSVCYLVPSREEQQSARRASAGAKGTTMTLSKPSSTTTLVSSQTPSATLAVDTIADDDDCSHCMSRPRSVVLAPCGHFQYCQQCIEGDLAPFVALHGCPLCRRPVSMHVKVFR